MRPSWDPPLRLHMIRALMERAKFLRESRIPPELRPLPKKRAEGLADVLPLGDPGREKAPDDSPEEASLHEWLASLPKGTKFSLSNPLRQGAETSGSAPPPTFVAPLPDNDSAAPAPPVTKWQLLHLLWFLPLAYWIVTYFVIPSAISGYHNAGMVFRRWSWGVLISPAAGVFFGSLFSTVLLPIRLLLLIPLSFEARGSRRLFLTAFLVVAAIWVSEVFLQFLIWGSFPLPVDADGNERLRLIPFLPWPNQPFWE